MKIKLLLILSLTAAALCGAPVTLKTPDISVTVLPEKGGKIVAIQNKAAQISIPADKWHTDADGLAKERIYGDHGEYMSSPWKVVSQTATSAVLQVTNLAPQRKLEITKTYTLPQKGGFVRIDLKFRNTNPVAGSFNIAPWISNVFQFPADAPGKNNTFYLSHKKGVQITEQSTTIVQQPTVKNTGNWSAYVNEAKKQGLLMVSARQPEVFYDYISGKTTGTMEMLFKAFDPVKQEILFTYYLAPVAGLAESDIAGLGLPVKLSPALNAERSSGDKVELTKHFSKANERNIPMEFRFYKSAAYVSPDVTLPLIFGVKNNKGGTLEAEIDLPEFVSLEGCSGNFWFYETEDFKLKSKEKVTVNGKNYTRCRFAVTARTGYSYPFHSRIYLRATRAEGKDEITYRAFRNGELSMESTVPCEVIAIPKARIPKEFKVYFGVDYCMLVTYPNFKETMKYLGINALNFNYNVPNKVVTAGQVRASNADLKKSGFSTSTMGIFFAPRGAGNKIKTLDIDGKTVNKFDFAARGEWSKEVVKHAKDKGLTLGYDICISDWEPYFGANLTGFSPLAVAKFKKFFTEKHPGKPWVDPAAIVKESSKYPEHYKIWTDFKCDCYASYLEEVIAAARAESTATKIGWCTIPGSSDEAIRIDNLQDTARFSSFLDYNMPMLYNNVYRTMANYRNELDFFCKTSVGKRAVVIPTLTIGLWGGDAPFPPEHGYFILLETALMQCPGAYIFPGFAGSDNKGVMYMSRAIDKIAEIEPLVKGAARQDWQVKIEDSQDSTLKFPAVVNPLVLVKKNRMLVYLAEYSVNPVTFKADFNLPADCKMTVLSGNGKNGIVSKGEKLTFTLTPGLGKGLLLLLETLDGSSFPILKKSTAAEQDAVDETGMVFYDGFEGSTKGRNGSVKHLYGFADNGRKGKCLSIRDYEAFWLLPETFDFASQEFTIDFHYRPTRNVLPEGKISWDIARGYFGRNRGFWLFFDKKTGKMKLQISQTDAKGKVLDWTNGASSKNDRRAANMWLHIQIKFEKSAIRLMVNGKEELVIPKKFSNSPLKNLQFGRPFVSMGAYDELRIYDGKK